MQKKKRVFWDVLAALLILFGLITTLSASLQKALPWMFVGSAAVVIGVLLFAWGYGE